MKLKTKTLLMIIIPVCIIFVLIIGYSSITLYLKQKESVETTAKGLSTQYGQQMQMQVEKALNEAKAIAEMSGGLVENGNVSREALDVAIKKVIENNDNFYGAWVGFEKNAFDGKDAQYANTEGYDETGRVIPYWYREGNNLVRYYLEGYNEEGIGDFYLVSLHTGKEFITEPTAYELGGKMVLMTSLTVPIKSNDKVIGVAGVDITLDQLVGISNTLKVYQTGYGRLISAKGMTVTHRDAEKIGKKAEEFEGNEANAYLKKINSGEAFARYSYSKSTKDTMYNVYEPFQIGKSGIYWVFNTVIPEKEMFKEVNTTIRIVICIAIVSMLLLTGIIIFISRKIAELITEVTKILHKQSKLDFTFDEKSKALKYIRRKDEIGIMVNAIKIMEDNVRDFIIKTQDAAGQVASSSEELTATSEQAATASEEVANAVAEIAKGSSEQAKDTETVADHMNNMGGLLEEDGRYIEEMNNAVEEISKQKEEGFVIVNELINKTNKSNSSSEKIYSIILSNNESASKIEAASTMIQSIAEQTNLLSLNATIEAARAGESGKGFAVVANEIRNLADQTNRFTNDISVVINELKIKSQNAVETMEEVKLITADQTKSVKQTEGKFESIAVAIRSIEDIIIKLNSSLEKMLVNKNEIIDLTSNLSAISEENAAGTEETSAAMEEQSATIVQIANSAEVLAKVSVELQTLVEKFKY